MLTFDEALSKATARIAELSRDVFGGRDLVVFTDWISEDASGWTFPYNTRRFLETGFPLDGLVGNRPVFVDKEDGSVHIVPTGPKGKWLSEYALAKAHSSKLGQELEAAKK